MATMDGKQMNKDQVRSTEEALDLALDALDNLLYWDNGKSDYDQAREAITAIKQARSAPVQEPVAKPKLIGWRTADFLNETTNIRLAQNWEVHYEVLPIFEGDPNTKLATPPAAVVNQQLTTEPAAHRQWVGLLQQCENEMRYAGWDKLETDNFARNGVYEQVKQYLEKNSG